MRADERMLEERPEGAIAFHRHTRAAAEHHQAPRAGQSVAPATCVTHDRGPPEPEEDTVGREHAARGPRRN